MGIVNLNDGTILAPGLRFDQDPDTGLARSAANTLDFITNGVKQASLSTTTLTLVGGQIAFPATQSASANANTLDDYEEGTWTPTIGGTATYAVQTGRYIKVGKAVFVFCDLEITLLGTGSTQTISGMPFTSVTAGSHGLAIGYYSALANGNFVDITVYQVSNTATVNFATMAAAGTGVSAGAPILGNNAIIIFAGYYETNG